ncbi:acyltransferase [Hydrogenimonas urashimensis]|uniref:acyltransferase n=1 Tax=Hydrogenimonas urashimensis TaxID=2740515 RepID=UPI001915234D|nr:acyltransferase [Hydrogenimonas urashimensis]
MRIKTIMNLIYRHLISCNKLAQKEGVRFGKNCQFNTKIFGTEPYLIEIGDNFYSSRNVKFVTHDGSVNVIRNLYPEYKNIDLFDKIIIGNNVFIGINATILPGSTIGDNVIVGANSLVKGTLNSNSVYAGNPVRYICSIEEYLQKHKNKFDFTKNMSKKEKKKYLMEKFKIGS